MNPLGRIVTTGRTYGCSGTTEHDNTIALSNKLTRFEISYFFGISQQVEILNSIRLTMPYTAKRGILDLWDRYIYIIREVFDKACKLFHAQGIRLAQPIVYREQGFFPGRELYFLDPSGNMLELRDPTWKSGMPQPTYEEIVRS